MSIFTAQSETFLKKYLNNHSPTGFESSGQQIWIDYLKEYIDNWESDAYGTAYGIINPGKDFKVVIEAHADEISWFVNHITDKGFIHVVRNGGSDPLIAPSKRVHVHTADGMVKGVFGFPAIHVRDAESKIQAKTHTIFIDVGASSKQEVLDMGIHAGCVATFDDEIDVLNDKWYVGRALDNRMGGFCIAQVARLIKEQNIDLPYSLYIVNSVQEEVGLRGAEMIANTIAPDLAIITDVTHDTGTPMMNAKKQGDIKGGEGPSITYAPAIHYKLLHEVIAAAESNEIPLQREASSRRTGTDTDAFAYSNKGVPSVLISLPLRYMHTTVEMVHKTDMENVSLLILETLKRIQPDKNLFKYLVK
ncbi:MAG: M42 family metallopeptidase [Bacteroidota bacterium]